MCGYCTPEEQRVRDTAEDLLAVARDLLNWASAYDASTMGYVPGLGESIKRAAEVIAAAEGKEAT